MKHFLILLIFITSCNSKKDLATNKFTQANSYPYTPAPLIPEKIDASKLILYGLSTVNADIAGVTSGSISFDASDFTQWIEVKSCPSTGSCSSGTSVTQRVDLPPFEPGPVEVSLRGCVESKYALDPNTNCGEWTSVRYNQPDTSSPFKAQLLREEAARISEIEATVAKLKVISESFARQMETCEKNASKVAETRARGNLIVGLLGIGEVLAGKAVSMYFKKNPIAPVSSGIEASKGAVDPASAATAKETPVPAGSTPKPSTEVKAASPSTTEGAAKSASTPASPADVPKKPSFIDSSLKNQLGKVDIKGAFAGISTASDKLGGLASPIAYIKQGASAAGLFQGGNPISAFGAIGGAIFGAFNANNLVLETCTARERYEASAQSLMLKLNSERYLLQSIYKQLEKELP
ncbi:MAG: hypothetical protein WCI18_15860 [Pseudomonadota bacterium]